MQQVLADDKLKNDFKLDERIFADAGRPQKIEYSGNTVTIKLDGRASFDPADPTGLNLSYQWYSVDASGSESAILSIPLLYQRSLYLILMAAIKAELQVGGRSNDSRSSFDDTSVYLLSKTTTSDCCS